MQDIHVEEWQTVVLPAAGASGAALAGFDMRAREIVANLKDKLEILELRRGVEVRATSWVGRVAVGDLTITVRPKITGLPLLNLLRYAYSLRELEVFTPTKYGTSKQSFQDIIVEQLANEVIELLSRGLYRDYSRFDANLASPRGRIQFTGLARGISTASTSIICTYYNRSESVLLNRVLLAGIRLAQRICTDNQLRAAVHRLAQILETSVPRMSLRKSDFDDARHLIDRRSSAYGPALTLIEMLSEGTGISLADFNDAVPLSSFLFDMNVFFQSLVLRLLTDELPEVRVLHEHRLKEIFEYDQANNPQRRRATVPRPDFAVAVDGSVELLDAKYRDLWETSLPRSMLYQLAIYALSKKSSQMRATILYPTLAATAVDQVIFLKDLVLGQKRASVVLRPVNLLEVEDVVRLRDGAAAERKRRMFASGLVFGSGTDVQQRFLAKAGKT